MNKMIVLLTLGIILLSGCSKSIKKEDYKSLKLTAEEKSEIQYNATFTLGIDENSNPIGKEIDYKLGCGKNLYFYLHWLNLFQDDYILITTLYNKENKIIDQDSYEFHPNNSKTSWLTWYYNAYNENNAEKGVIRYEIKLNNTIIGNEYITFK